jgi:hypothetical protein
VVSQRPYGPFQTDGTWLHGIDHTRATYTDGHAETLLAGQALAWIGGTTGSPTATATISGTVAGSVANIVMQPGGGGGVFIGAGTSAQYININGASGQNNGVNWQTAGNMRWRLITDASDLLNLYAYSAAGAFLGTVCSFEPTLCHVNVDLYASRVGFNGTAPIAKPTGYTAPTGTATRATFATTSVTLPVLAEHVKALIDDLTAYGLIGP